MRIDRIVDEVVQGQDYSNDLEQILMYIQQNNVDAIIYKTTNTSFDPSERNSIALFRACELGRTEIVRFLLEDGRADPSAVSPNDRTSTCLDIAFQKNYLMIAQLLIDDCRVLYKQIKSKY